MLVYTKVINLLIPAKGVLKVLLIRFNLSNNYNLASYIYSSGITDLNRHSIFVLS